MLSDSPSELLDLPSLEQQFLAALRHNDTDRLVQVTAQLDHLGHVLEQAPSPKNTISNDKATAISVFSHNAYVASSLADKVQLEMEQLASRFTQQLSLLPLPALPVVPSPRGLAPVESCSSAPNLVFKKWSLTHMHDLFPSKAELEELASQTSTSQNQINLWFRNARTRSGWSKLFAHPRVNKNNERLKALLEEYHSTKRHGNPEHVNTSLAPDELLQILDKVFLWFNTTKQGKPSQSDSVKPWVKEVLNNALAMLRDKTAGAKDSSRQLLHSLPSRKRARTKKNFSSPSPLSQLSTPIAGPSSAPTLESSRCSSLSLPTTTGAFSNPSSISTIAFSPFSGSPSSESLYSGDSSPGPVSTCSPHFLRESHVLSSLPTTCTPTSLSPMLGTTTHPPFPLPNHSMDPDQFEDADEE